MRSRWTRIYVCTFTTAHKCVHTSTMHESNIVWNRRSNDSRTDMNLRFILFKLMRGNQLPWKFHVQCYVFIFLPRSLSML